MSNFEILISGLLTCFGLGWAVGRWIKALRQVLDQL